jgi:hypothetical protein
LKHWARPFFVGGTLGSALNGKLNRAARTIIECVTTRMSDSAETPSVPGAPATVPADRSLTTASTSARPARAMKPVPIADRGTLTANDLSVPWHGPAQAHVPLPPRRAARPSV